MHTHPPTHLLISPGHELHAAQAELQRLSGLVMAFHEAVARALGTVW